LNEKQGQIAHLNHDPADNDEDNLTFLCLRHHSLYDSTTSQHKNYTAIEVKDARDRLCSSIARRSELKATKRDDPNQRPYISIAAIGLEAVKVSPGPIKIVWQIRNGGHTPATIVAANMTAFFASEENPLPDNPQYLPNRHNLDGAIVAPNGGIFQASFECERILSGSDVHSIENGTVHMYVFGFVRYRDSAATERSKGFSALYKPTNNRAFGMFSTVGDKPTYEYGD
jgi:hypothetical protein